MTRRPSGSRGGRSSASSDLVLVALGIAAGLPALVAAVRAARWGWVPAGDSATIATRSFDVLSSRFPLLGQASTSAQPGGAQAWSPGPAGYWLWALPTRVGPLWMPAVTAGVVSAISLAMSVVLAGRRAGLGFAVAVAVGLVFVARALDPVHLASIWNPSSALAPFVLLFFLCWSVGVGRLGWFPLTVAVASVVSQSHLAFLVAAVPMVGLAGAVGFAPAVRARWPGRRPGASSGLDSADEGDRRDHAGRWALLGTGVGAVAWALPLWQQFTGDPGNITALLSSAGATVPPLGWSAGRGIVAFDLGIVPRFLRGVQTPEESLTGPPDAALSLGVVSAVAVVVGLIVFGARGLRARQRETWVPIGLVLVAVGAGFVTASRTPADVRVLTTIYTLRWLIPIGLLAWCVLGLAVARWPGVGRDHGGRVRSAPPVVTAGVLALVAAMAVFSVAMPERDFERPLYGPLHQMGDDLVAATQPGQRYLIEVPGLVEGEVAPALVYQLRRAGVDPVAAGDRGRVTGSEYRPAGRPCAGVVRVVPSSGEDEAGPNASGTVLGRYEVPGDAPIPVRRLTVTLSPAAGRSC